MITVDDVSGGNIKEQNSNWTHISDHLYRKLIISCTGIGKINAILDLIIHQVDSDKIYLYTKSPCWAK